MRPDAHQEVCCLQIAGEDGPVLQLDQDKGPSTASMLGLSSLHLLEAAITSVFLLPPLL